MNKSIQLLLFITIFVFKHECSPSKKPGYGPGEQDWGWIDVRTGSHMFYWLYFTTSDSKSVYDRPLVIWLQGGPGASSTGYGNFAEIGPLHINGSHRQYAWTKQVNVLFIDNPVGAGFSYVDNINFLAKNNVQIGADMMVFLINFYQKYPGFKRSPMYIISESYGGKMAVEIGKQLDELIKSGKLNNINFKGIALGDSWISPVDSVLTWSPLLLNVGLIDERSHNRIMKSATEIKAAVESGQYAKATALWSSLEVKILEETGNVDFYNILYKVHPRYKVQNLQDSDLFLKQHVQINDDGDIESLMNGAVRKVLNIPSNVIHGRQRSAVFNALTTDFMKPVTHVVEHLLNNTELKVIVFSGQLDLIVDTYGTMRWVDRLRWKGSSKWQSAKREPFILDDVIEGYEAKALNLHFYWINRAGHMVPTDNPKTAMEMLRRITKFDENALTAFA